MEDLSYEKWSMENTIIKGWLVGAMEPNVMNLFIRLPTIKSIWKTVSKTYYQKADRYIIYDLFYRVMHMKEGRSIVAYSKILHVIRQELDYPKPILFTQVDVVCTRQKENVE